MGKIREILLTEYIGAITIGLVVAQAIFSVVSAVVSTVSVFWARRNAGSVFYGDGGFSWSSLASPLASGAIYLLVAFLLIRWLYLPAEESESGDGRTEEDNGEQDAKIASTDTISES